MKKYNILFFAERHLVRNERGGEFKVDYSKPPNAYDNIQMSKIDLSEKVEVLPKQIPFKEAQRATFVKNEMVDIESGKLNEFLLIAADTTNPSQLHKMFFIKVLGFKQDYLNKQKNLNSKLTIIIKGFQKHLNEKFPKSKIKVDGKLGKQTLARMADIAAIENGSNEYDKGGMMMDISDSFAFGITQLNPAKLATCAKISNSDQRNLYMWTKILNLDEPSKLVKTKDDYKLVKDLKYTNEYIKGKFKHLQRYLAAKTGKKLTADGKFGPKSIAIYQEHVTALNKAEANREKAQAAEYKKQGLQEDGFF